MLVFFRPWPFFCFLSPLRLVSLPCGRLLVFSSSPSVSVFNFFIRLRGAEQDGVPASSKFLSLSISGSAWPSGQEQENRECKNSLVRQRNADSVKDRTCGKSADVRK